MVLSALRRLRESGHRASLTDVAETIKRMSFKVTRAGELIGQEVARRLGNGVRFSGGTIASMLDLMDGAASDRELARLLRDPYALPHRGGHPGAARRERARRSVS